MKGQTNRSIIDNGLQRSLRRRMTDAEIRLWQRLRARQVEGFKFRRQHPFLDYVLDFVCLEARLIVEVDGGQHQGAVQDGVRDRRLHAAGFRVIRFWNNQVLRELDAVVDAIRSALIEESERTGSQSPPSPPQPLKGRGREPVASRVSSARYPNPAFEGEGAPAPSRQRRLSAADAALAAFAALVDGARSIIRR